MYIYIYTFLESFVDSKLRAQNASELMNLIGRRCRHRGWCSKGFQTKESSVPNPKVYIYI